jgi:hypothetical protein|tara:strand:+ start:506 stop:706 length:201 start_codon:yes stop_codon:yes gene_type:complete
MGTEIAKEKDSSASQCSGEVKMINSGNLCQLMKTGNLHLLWQDPFFLYVLQVKGSILCSHGKNLFL